jgi:hypothetical protein
LSRNEWSEALRGLSQAEREALLGELRALGLHFGNRYRIVQLAPAFAAQLRSTLAAAFTLGTSATAHLVWIHALQTLSGPRRR